MLELTTRPEAVEAMQYLYGSSAPQFAEACDGLLDLVTSEVYVSTPDGVRKVGMNDWVVRHADGMWRVMTDTEIRAAYVPADVQAAVRATGGRYWA